MSGGVKGAIDVLPFSVIFGLKNLELYEVEY